MRPTFAALALALAAALAGTPAVAQALSGPAPDAGADPCADPQTQAERTACAVASWQEADARLNAAWKRVRERLKRQEADFGPEGLFDAMLEGQRGWLAYRDRQCEVEGHEARGGTMEPMIVSFCKARLTRRRIVELEESAVSPGAVESGTAPACARLGVDALEAEHPSGTLYRFPRVGGDSTAAAKIDAFLHDRVLEKAPGAYRDNPFEDVWPQEESDRGLVQLDYAVAFDPPGILGVEIFREFLGAYPSAAVDRFYFDACTGRPIGLRELLSPEGLAALDREIRETRLRRIDAFLAGETVGGARLRDDPDEAAEQRSLYGECRARIERSSAASADDLRLGRGSFELVPEPCGPRVVQALLDLDLSIDRGYEGVAGHLDGYGRCLLLERRARCPR